MCGIAGYCSPAALDERVLMRMLQVLRHRGPDSTGVYRTAGYCAGVQRLSINDVTSGDQPLFDETESIVLFYNGEIYNSPQLRRELEGKRIRFRTHSDGEVICHLYAEYGEQLFERLDGMFAAALWIESEQRLILARDLVGEKPLYYTELADGGVAFASEIKGLTQLPGIDRSLDHQALWDYPTFLWIPEPRTVYRSIRALPRGHLLIVDRSGIRLQAYANRFYSGATLIDDRDAITETRRVVTEAVQSRLLSDVPIGCLLSSGLDSSIVATIAAQKVSLLNTFTVGFENIADPYHGQANEADYAELYARRLGTRHQTIRVTADTMRASLDDFSWYGDQPFAVSSGLGIMAVAGAARDAGVKVLLSGDGADECFGGYSWYEQLEHAADHSPGETTRDSRLASFHDMTDRTATLAAIAGYPADVRAWALHYYASESDKQRLYSEDYFAGQCHGASTRHFAAYDPTPSWKPEGHVAHDREFYFPNEMLRKLDRMTMAHSVEGRAPFAAPSVMSLAKRLSYSQHMVRDGTLKWVLRKAFAHLLPGDVAMRPKHGFNVPIDSWLRSQWADLVAAPFAADSSLRRYGIVGPDSGAAARAMLADPTRFTGHTIFCFIMLERWLANQ